MTLVIVLLFVIVLLLAAIIAMMVTGWPGRHRSEIELLGADLRREIAESRGDSIRLLQSIRSEVEDAVEESLNREMASLIKHGGVGHPSMSDRRTDTGNHASPPVSSNLAVQNRGVMQRPGRPGQLSLFAAESPDETSSPVPVPQEPETGLAPKSDDPPMEKVQAVIYDDIPDMGDIPDIDDLD